MHEKINAEKVVTGNDVDAIMQNAADAFEKYKKVIPARRACFLEKIAGEMEKLRPQLVTTANEESNLPLARLNGELTRTTNQLKLFATMITEGSWVEASIDSGNINVTPAKPDIRKMLVPVGPVVVFGASNFPFAFSTAGGDTASALASGSVVVIKAHSAHVKTSELVFNAIQNAIELVNMPTYTVQHVVADGNKIGEALVTHPYTTGVGFTGSFSGGKALVQYSNQRDIPIPVFAEMSSINPVVFYPDMLSGSTAELASTYALSITVGAGQFCTNPGILIGIKSDAFDKFLNALAKEIGKVLPQKMLHAGIYDNYSNGLAKMLQKQDVGLLSQSSVAPAEMEAAATITTIPANKFLNDKHFAEEIFGPYSMAVLCSDKEELINVLKSLKGQLTTTIMGTDRDITEYADVIEIQHSMAGRIILNNAPTGVEVCASMVHGGPYPATTDARFTSVGTTAIKRWVRPVCFQNFKDAMLPNELKNNNQLAILRLVNNNYTRDGLHF